MMDPRLTPDQYLVTYSVGPNQNGVRLDQFLKARYTRRSREQLKRAIADGAITVKRTQSPHLTMGKEKPSSQLIPGDEVHVLTEKKPEPEVRFDYQVLFEDESLFVINKPPMLPVHPAGRYFFNTLLVHLKTAGHQKPLNADQDYYLVHRIDKETSGILVLAKTKTACAHLTRQFAARSTEKRYLAIVRGICPESFVMDLPMKRATQSEIKLKMVPASLEDGGQSSLTSFQRLEVRDGFSLVECFPKTGRQHQIRVHLDAAGFPIVGDKLYGLSESDALQFFERKHLSAELQARLLLPHHALHAAGIRFTHPTTQEPMEFSAPLPEDLVEFFYGRGAKRLLTISTNPAPLS
jgi:23S rRNA pseudouridine1911/1915/1917 synthase